MTQRTTSEIESLEPKAVWKLFAGMSAVPRPSKQEERIREHTRAVAADMGFKVRQDATGNLLIEVPASPGCDRAPITVLQGHLDMVCEKNAGTEHDFDRDPIRLLLERDAGDEPIVRADGTTLGADNGIGVCMALAAASSPEVKHGPIEILCTIDEEMGMTGAKALASDFFKGRRMINLDSEEDDAIYIGCAGGCDTNLTWQLPSKPPEAGSELMRVTVSGLRGGHSGGDIHLNRANAIKLLVQTLRCIEGDALQLAEFTGGSKRNAIPREASALIAGPAGTAAALEKAAECVEAGAIDDAGDKDCTIRIARVSGSDVASVASGADTARLLTAIAALPHGVLAVVPEIAGLVQTSNSVSTVVSERTTSGLRVVVGCLSRSSSDVQIETTVRQIHAVGKLASATIESGNDYPGWQPDVDSALLATCRRVYERLFEDAPGVTAIHAGLECGIIGQRMGKMDMVSFGPRIEGAHSPDERVYVESVKKSWKYLVAVLAELAGG